LRIHFQYPLISGNPTRGLNHGHHDFNTAGTELRINFALYGLPRSGGVRVVCEMANRLARRGHEVTITTPFPRDELTDPFKIEVPVNSPPRGRYVENSKLFDWTLRAGFSMARRLGYKRTFDFDVVKKLAQLMPECDANIATFYVTAFAVHRSGKGTPFYYVQGYEPDFSDEVYSSKMAEESYCLPLKIITVSSWLRETLRAKYSRDAFVCLNGVDRDVFHPMEKTPREVRRVFCVGRSERRRGLPDLVDAMNIVHQEYPNVELTIASLAEHLPMTATEFPYRIVSSSTDEALARLYSDSDVFVSPSWLEGFPLPPLEAMSCGTPVITTNVGTEDYAFNGVNSLVVPPQRPKELAKAILQLLRNDDLGEALTQEGLRTASQFSWEKTADCLEGILRHSLSS